MDTSTPPDTSLSTHHPHGTIEASDTDVATPVLTGTHLATITSHGRRGRGVISRGETLPRGLIHPDVVLVVEELEGVQSLYLFKVMVEVVGVEVFLLEVDNVDEGMVMV